MTARIRKMTQDAKGDHRQSKMVEKKCMDERKKDRDQPPTKVVIRRLPPSLTPEVFLEQVSPLPPYDYFYFVKADMSLASNAFTRAYINFPCPDDIYNFKDKFDDYVFLDKKGNEYPAVVEFAPFQKVPKKKMRKADTKKGTIEQDGEYQKFLEILINPEIEPTVPIETYLEELENKKKELKANHGVPKMTTPLIEYIRRKKEEKKANIQRQREDRKKREHERKKAREEEKRRRKEKEKEKREEKKQKEKDGLSKKDDPPIKFQINRPHKLGYHSVQKRTLYGHFQSRHTGASAHKEIQLLKNPEREQEKQKEEGELGRGKDESEKPSKEREKLRFSKENREKLNKLDRQGQERLKSGREGRFADRSKYSKDDRICDKSEKFKSGKDDRSGDKKNNRDDKTDRQKHLAGRDKYNREDRSKCYQNVNINNSNNNCREDKKPRHDKQNKHDRVDKFDRPEKQDKYERMDRQDKFDRSDKPDRLDRLERHERSEKQENEEFEKSTHEKKNKADKLEKVKVEVCCSFSSSESCVGQGPSPGSFDAAVVAQSQGCHLDSDVTREEPDYKREPKTYSGKPERQDPRKRKERPERPLYDPRKALERRQQSETARLQQHDKNGNGASADKLNSNDGKTGCSLEKMSLDRRERNTSHDKGKGSNEKGKSDKASSVEKCPLVTKSNNEKSVSRKSNGSGLDGLSPNNSAHVEMPSNNVVDEGNAVEGD